MNAVLPVRNYCKVGDALPVPELAGVQVRAYEAFLQEHVEPEARESVGLEALLREMFPIESYDGSMGLHYISYELGKPRYTPDECRELRLTFGLPLRIRLRLVRKEIAETQTDARYMSAQGGIDRVSGTPDPPDARRRGCCPQEL